LAKKNPVLLYGTLSTLWNPSVSKEHWDFLRLYCRGDYG